MFIGTDSRCRRRWSPSCEVRVQSVPTPDAAWPCLCGTDSTCSDYCLNRNGQNNCFFQPPSCHGMNPLPKEELLWTAPPSAPDVRHQRDGCTGKTTLRRSSEAGLVSVAIAATRNSLRAPLTTGVASWPQFQPLFAMTPRPSLSSRCRCKFSERQNLRHLRDVHRRCASPWLSAST